MSRDRQLLGEVLYGSFLFYLFSFIMMYAGDPVVYWIYIRVQMRACVRVLVRACMRACVCVGGCLHANKYSHR